MRPPNRHRREHSLGLSLSTPERTQQLSSVRRLIFYFAQLNPTTLAYSGQTLTLRLGAAAVTVNLTDSAAAVGTLGASSVVFKAGDSSVQTTFQPVRGGLAKVGFASTSTGYSAASNDNTTTFTVTTPNSSLILCKIYTITPSTDGWARSNPHFQRHEQATALDQRNHSWSGFHHIERSRRQHHRTPVLLSSISLYWVGQTSLSASRLIACDHSLTTSAFELSR